MGRIDEGVEAYRRAVELDPSDFLIHCNLVFCVQYLQGNEGKITLAEARQWDSQHAEPLRKGIEPHGNSRDPDRRLRIGYVSNDFREHSVSRFLQQLFQNHDHGNFEIVCYSDVRNPDSLTALLRGCADQWHDIKTKTDQSLAEMIRGDGIDILVDLMGYTAHNRLMVFGRKPAPIQISYLGHPGTTGLAIIDYRLTDGLSDPPGMTDAYYTEGLLRLPRTNWCFAPPPKVPEVGPSPVSQGRPLCFGSFNKLAKATPQVLDMWAEILSAAAGSRLILKSRALADPLTHARVCREFELRGVSPERLELVGFENDLASHFQMYGQVDIALDTFPYHGTTTTCEALWMGAPVVTLAGETHLARVGVSLLTNVGLAELIASSAEEYVSIAVGLARDHTRLRELRGGMRQRMLASPLMDGRQFARDVEGTYREVWRRWCAGS
jgi:predicted O-linked N-acetylglucosamine transferase (SPINDLY family)